MEPQELAARAADYIEEHGHTKNRLEDNFGRVCISGAIIAAGGGNASPYGPVVIPDEWNKTMALVRNHLDLDSSYSVIHWNNAPVRTQDEVVAVLRAVAGQPVKVADAHDQSLQA